LILQFFSNFLYAAVPTPVPDFPRWHDPEEFEGDFE